MLQWIKDGIKAIHESAGARFELFSMFVAWIAGFLTRQQSTLHLQSVNKDMLLDHDWGVSLLVAIGFLFYWSLKAAITARRKLEPKIQLDFLPDEECIVQIAEGQRHDLVSPATGTVQRIVTARYDTTYVRVKTTSLSAKAAPQCEAFLSRVERQTKTSTHSIPFDPIQLPWAHKSVTAIDIRHMLPHHFDVVKGVSAGNRLVPCFPVPNNMSSFFDEIGTYIFDVAVVCDGITTPARFKIQWFGKWDTIKGEPCPQISQQP